MNCPYCKKELEIKPNGGVCWALEDHTFIYLNNKDETFRVKIEDIQVFIFKEGNIFIFSTDNDEEYKISETRYKEAFNLQSKDEFDIWICKVNKEIVFK